jgi:hypothetical protein
VPVLHPVISIPSLTTPDTSFPSAHPACIISWSTIYIWCIFWRFRRIASSEFHLDHVCWFVCLHRTARLPPDGLRSLIVEMFRKSVEKIKVSLKCDQNDVYFTWRRFHICDNILMNSAYNENVVDESCRENHNTHFMFNNLFTEIVPFVRQCRKMWWNQRGRRRQRSACALHAG